MNTFFVYILTNKNHTVLYTGFTDDVYRRTFEHKEKILKGFTSKFNVDKLVYFEKHNDMEEALLREKSIKRYKRDWKVNMINSINPEWRDLFDGFIKELVS